MKKPMRLTLSPDGRDLVEILLEAELDDVAFQTRQNVRLAASRSHPLYIDEEDDVAAAVRYSARIGRMLLELAAMRDGA